MNTAERAILKSRINALGQEGRYLRGAEQRRRDFSRLQRRLEAAELLNQPVEVGEAALADSRQIHHYRTVNIRSEARASQLAYAFVRGREFDRTEQPRHTAPPWDTVFAIVRALRPSDTVIELRGSLTEWIERSSLPWYMKPKNTADENQIGYLGW